MTKRIWKQFSRLTAVIVVSLLCAQSLAASHSHDLIDADICAVCAASTDEGIASESSVVPLSAAVHDQAPLGLTPSPDIRPIDPANSRAPPTS